MHNQVKQSYAPLCLVNGLTLSIMSPQETENYSVREIYEDQIYKENGDPVEHGINDDVMGTMDRDRLCKTCKGTQESCPGHFGHIKLAKPVYHASMLEYIRKVLRMVCFRCSHLLANNPEQKVELKMYQNIRNAKNKFNKVFSLASGIKECGQCKTKNHLYKKGSLRIDYEIQDPSYLRQDGDSKQTLWPEDAQAILAKITNKDLKLMGLDKEKCDPANMIISNLAVAPPPVRPSVAMTNTMRSEDDLTFAYKTVIKQNNEIKRYMKSESNETTIRQLRVLLQFYVATVMDNEISGQPTHRHKSGKPLKAIRARLRGKEGRMRGNLMGKRVDFSARTVITPDPNLMLDQLGVPKEIAMNMTVPEVVTDHNIDKLRTLVDRGANNWPGAKYIKRSDGKFIDLAFLPNRTDQHLEKGYTVERHVMNDDYVIFNRQPSLHKMSLMGHRVRVLDFQTFRLNLSVTTPYNADFDGDEMNMHVPQSLETKAEIKEIMAVPRQIVAPQSNKPCMGIVQDSLLGINRMTKRDTFIDKALMMQVLMCIDYDIAQGLPTPAIIKPKPLWTGKQLLSLVIPKVINFEKINDKAGFCSKDDSTYLIQKGELLQGNMFKGIVGNAANGLIHIVWKELGPYGCRDILTQIQFCVNNWLVQTGFTVGVADIIAKTEIVNQVKDAIDSNKRKVRKVIKASQDGKLKTLPGKTVLETFEHEVNQSLNTARDTAGQIALKALSSDNRLKNMVNAGSKGSNLNISQIMACVGQQNVEGKRIPFGFNKRALPHFLKDDLGPESKGFVENSYLTGLTPSEFYFHAMGGREGLIDTAVKTAETGYIQRRLIKALEDVMVKYDGSVRTSKNVILQYLYGEDGMAGEHIELVPLDLIKLDNKKLNANCNMIQKLDDRGFKQQLSSSVDESIADKILSDKETQELFQQEIDQLFKDRKSLREEILKNHETQIAMPVNIKRLISNVKSINNIKPNSISDIEPKYFFDEMQKLQDSLFAIPEASLKVRQGIDLSGVIAEAHENSTKLFKIYLRRNLCAKKIMLEDRLNVASFDQLVNSIKEVFRASIVHPGEMVGSIGAQSMGEPATQMTLNTFHNAGISSKNVTLGVPRLKEVINVAKTIKTPSLKIFLDNSINQDQAAVSRIGNMIEYLNLSHLINEWGIYYDPDPEETVIEKDKELIAFYADAGQINAEGEQRPNPWLLRFEVDPQKALSTFDDDFLFTSIGQKLEQFFANDAQLIYSEELMESHVIRIRLYDVIDEDEGTVAMFYREIAESLLNNITLRGFVEIPKISYTQNSDDCKVTYYDEVTGAQEEMKACWIIETDGVALQKVFALEGVNCRRTTSNHIIEILQVLGIEAVRNCLLKELRMILGTYGIYVNYRHLATLCDVMTQRGILTSITRHGINRVDSGPLRKASFEETTEILLEAAFFGEFDPLTGITENIIFGQLCPYGTGSFSLVTDAEALSKCSQDRAQVTSEYSPVPYQVLTPVIGNTPDQNTMQGGMSSAYTPNPGDCRFTPIASPSSMASPSPMYSVYSQEYGAQMGATSGGQTGAYKNVSTPAYNYQSPSYGTDANRGSGGASASYNPMTSTSGGPMHAAQHSSYSPTNQMAPYQSPSYTPNTPNYAAYGTSSMPQYSMLNMSSPKFDPVTSSSPQMMMNSASSNNSGAHHSSVSSSPGTQQSLYSNLAFAPVSIAYNPNSPSYVSSLNNQTPSGNNNQQDNSTTPNLAYNPENKSNQDKQ